MPRFIGSNIDFREVAGDNVLVTIREHDACDDAIVAQYCLAYCDTLKMRAKLDGFIGSVERKRAEAVIRTLPVGKRAKR